MSSDPSKLLDWNPHSSHSHRFAVAAASIRLYQTNNNNQTWKYENTTPSPSPSQPLSQTQPLSPSLSSVPPAFDDSKSPSLSADSPDPAFKLLDTINYPQQSVRCMSWCLDPREPLLLSGGLLSGRLVLMRFLSENKIVKEFVPKYARACHCIAWNPMQTQQIAVGLDRVRNGCGTLIWDVNQRGGLSSAGGVGQPAGQANLFSITANKPVESVSDPLGRVSNSEATLALSWLPGDPFSLAVGTGFKWLRIYDIRGNSNSSRPLSVVAHSKSVFGVKFEPGNANRLATHSEDGIVKLWDLRSLRGPVFSLQTSGSKSVRPKPLLQMEWSTTSRSLLSTVAKDDDYLRMWDLSGSLPSDLTEVERLSQLPDTGAADIPPCRKYASSAGPLAALSWHPSIKHRLLTITTSGVVESISYHTNVPVSWTAANEFSFAVDEHAFIGNRTNQIAVTQGDSLAVVSNPLNGDIASVMRSRALAGYNFDISLNARIAADGDEGALARVWRNFQSASMDSGYAGIQSVLTKGGNDNVTKEGQTAEGAPVDSAECSPSNFKCFTSPARIECMKRCGWFACVGAKAAPGRKELDSALKALEDAGQHERAACIALFHLDLKRALATLAAGADLGLVALALSGYATGAAASADALALWGRSVQQQKLSAYLRAMFGFLSSSSAKPSAASYRVVLDESGLELTDRLAFACRFLPDSELALWLAQTVKACMDTGDLAGLLLTGLSAPEGPDLLQAALDRSGDVQTTALLSAYAQTGALLLNPSADPDQRFNQWIAAYKSLLNQWRMWDERAKFDVARALLHAEMANAGAAAGVAASPAAASGSEGGQSLAATRTARSKALLNLRPQVYARCNFCGQSLSLENMNSAKSGQSRSAGGFRPRARIGASKTTGPENTTRVKGCPSCKKSLPRCSLCLVSLDAATPGPIGHTTSGMNRTASKKGLASLDDSLNESFHSNVSLADERLIDSASMNDYRQWFTWCQRCHHGGHSEHIQDWFQQHQQCPVTDCHCRCQSLDAVTANESEHERERRSIGGADTIALNQTQENAIHRPLP